jgi:hypothetical protein
MKHVEVLAHGVTSRQDLPLPFSYAVAGGAVAMLISFLVLAFLWDRSRFYGSRGGRPLPRRLASVLDSQVLRWALRAAGLLATGFVAFAAIVGPDLATNPTAGLVYVVFWVGLVPTSLLFGPVWKHLNPLRTIHLGIVRLLGQDPDDPPFTLPRWVGYWPAALSLFAFLWLELCAPERDSTGTIAYFFGMYALGHLILATAFGADWFTRCDGFEVYSTLLGRLSVLGRRDDGVLVVRNPLENLDSVREAPGLVAVVTIMLGSTAFDSVTSTAWWATRSYDSHLSPTELSTVALVVVILLVAAAFCLASWSSALLARGRPGGTATAFAHSVVPIAAGYLIAHYFSLFVYAGHQTLIRASDPLVNGSNLFGTSDWDVNYNLIHPTAIAVTQVAAIVLGHVLGVFAAHDRSVRLFPRANATIGQLPMMVLMIAYTCAGLTLLFAE